AELGSAMRVAESADCAIDGAAAFAPAAPSFGLRPASPLSRVSASPAVCVCPRCYSPNMAPSRRETIPVKLLRLFGVARYRCHACGKRSWWM
ncbi:MAG: hypothetical protein ABI972_31710, partial [Acidobacteriota bacterium]